MGWYSEHSICQKCGYSGAMYNQCPLCGSKDVKEYMVKYIMSSY